MHNFARRRDRMIVGLFLGAQLLLPLINIVFFRRRFTYPSEVIGYHLVIVGFAYLSWLGVASLVCAARPVRNQRAARYVLPLGWGICTVGLYYAYLLAWGGRLGNGMNMRVSWITPYVLHPSVAISTFSIPPVAFWGGLIGVPLVILALYAAAARAFAAVELRLLARMRLWWPTRRLRVRAAGVLVVAVLSLVGAVEASEFYWLEIQPATRLFGDPIFVSLLEENSSLPLAGVGDANVAYTVPARFDKKNVILIVVDACRADHLGVNGYQRDTTPFLDSLKRTGHLHAVRSYYSASCCTFGGVLTMLRSQYWFKMTLHGFALHDVLKHAGYKVHFLLSGDLSTFGDLKSYYGPNLDSFSDGLDRSRHYTLNDDRGFIESFDQLAPFDGTPSFLYFHLMSVH